MSEESCPVKPDRQADSAQKEMTPAAILNRARARSREGKLSFAGAVTPEEAWKLVEDDVAVMVDVRTLEEYKFVGHVPHSLSIPWMCGAAMTKNPGFLSEAEKQLGKDAIILLLCRSAKRSAGAAEALTAAGFRNVFNVLEGFEGSLDSRMQRNHLDGWRSRNLPWIQD